MNRSNDIDLAFKLQKEILNSETPVTNIMQKKLYPPSQVIRVARKLNRIGVAVIKVKRRGDCFYENGKKIIIN